MRLGGSARAIAIGGWLILASAISAAAQSVVTTGPAGNPTRDGTPRFSIRTDGFLPQQQPISLRLQISLDAGFTGPFWADTTVVGTSATVVIPRLLPEGTQIWWRTIARTTQGTLFTENAIGPVRTSRWLTLVSPNNQNGSIVSGARPTFLWSAVAIYPPVAPWRFDIVISRSSDGLPVLTGTDSDTSYVPIIDLEFNTPYRWSINALAGSGESVRVISSSSFVILSPNSPIATVLFQPFPNPFPNDRLSATCIWFDLKEQANVRLDVLDLRMNQVARIFPGRGFDTFPPGRYGRDVFGGDAGCDSRFVWDGTDDAGRVVRPGVYLVRFRAGKSETIKKVLFKGR
jgi:hypothetical protein